MKIIDVEVKGNSLRFYLGEKTEKWGWTVPDYKIDGETPKWLKPSDTYYGDDWDDAPYQHNAGTVYGEFIKGEKNISFKYGDVVVTPADTDNIYGRGYSKDDMVARKVPCVIIIPEKYLKDNDLYGWQLDTYEKAIGVDCAKKIYYGDDESVLKDLGGYLWD